MTGLRARRALTLFEVLISLVIVSIGALTLIALVSVGTRSQAKVRYEIHAGAAALSLLDGLHNPIPAPVIGLNTPDWRTSTTLSGGKPRLDVPPTPGTAAALRTSLLFAAPFQHDLERVTCSPTGLAIPLPPQIARRLASDGDEIQQVLDEGSSLYYLHPAGIRTITRSELAFGQLSTSQHQSEARKLVFAVRGHPQQNALPVHPWEHWPFYQVYPFPPQAVAVEKHGKERGVSLKVPDWPGDPDNLIVGGMSFTHGYHGRNWAYFRWEEQQAGIDGPWSRGWEAFQRLAGDARIDGGRYLTPWKKSEEVDPEELLGGYVPVQAMIYAGKLPTLAQRLNYLDRAMHLWNQVCDVPALTCAGETLPIEDSTRWPVMGEQAEHVYAPGAYATYFDTRAALIDPTPTTAGGPGLSDAQFPPHPTQVLALSYLAHAAIMVASYRAPYDGLPIDVADPANGVPRHPEDPLYPVAKWPLLAVPLADWPTDPQTLATFMKGYRDFARQAHEMSIRWAIAYARECPGDWGAPRPANSQVVTDQPLALFDLFYDAALTTAAGPDASASGIAHRTARNFRRYGGWTSESFYRWIDPPNPLRWNVGPRQSITHLGPNGTLFSAAPGKVIVPEFWASRVRSPQLRPPSATAPAYANADAERFWLHRPFEAAGRGRELVFWAVDWQGYEDAESVPSAPLDISQYGRAVMPHPDPSMAGSASDEGRLRPIRYPTMLGGAASTDLPLYESLLGHPERPLIWTDATRTATIGYPTVAASRAKTGVDKDADTVLGHWGADRNGDRAFTRGPIKATARLRAQLVARYTFYDPVLKLAVSQ